MVGEIKHIVIIESLKNERETGKELYDDCIERRIRLYKKDITHKFYPVHSKEEFLDVIQNLIDTVEFFQDGLLIHLEMHGDKNLKGLFLSDNSLIEWSELSDLFREINIGTCNKLFITMATCNGRFLYKGADSLKKSPYSGYISASKAVYPSEIVEKFEVLFSDLIENGNIVKAYLEMENAKSNFYYKDSKAVFEEGFNSFKEGLDNNPNLKQSLISDIIKDVKSAGEPVPEDDAKMDEIFADVLEHLYKKQKEGFEFDDC
jgi:hypothetical protein